MRILLSTSSLSGVGGSETYVTTLADQLQRLGHDVWLHALEHGRASELAENLGLRLVQRSDELPTAPDVLVVQDGAVACELAVTYPRTPQVFVAHGDIHDAVLPPNLPELTAVVVALYDRVERRIRALALDHEVARLTQPVDVERFKPVRPLRPRARVVLTFGNYMRGERLTLLRRACERAGLELRHVGMHGDGFVQRPEILLNEVDIVFGKARVIHEAMACGRAAYVFDHNGSEGWVTPASYPALASDNFGGQSCPAAIDEDRLVVDLARYHPGMGIANRDLAVAHHAAHKHAAEFVAVLGRVAPRPAPMKGPLRELARMVRLYHRADGRAFVLHAETERLAMRVHELEDEIAALRGEAEQARAEASRRVEESAHAWARLDAVKGSLRWRAAQAALRPLDSLRAAVTGRRERARKAWRR